MRTMLMRAVLLFTVLAGCGGGTTETDAGTSDASSFDAGAPDATPSCPVDTTFCDGMCISLESSDAHCGGCGVSCGEGESCVAGACVCESGVECDGACVDPESDQAFCGASGSCTGAERGTECGSGEVCAEGVCELRCGGLSPDRCETSEGAYCTRFASSVSDCGACGVVCALGEACVEGVCACPEGFVLCDGRCIDPETDDAFCGASGACATAEEMGRVCPAGTMCSAGVCAASCGSAFATCGSGEGSYCADTERDPDNCGGCADDGGSVCDPTATRCEGGACVTFCPSGLADCDESLTNLCEVDVTRDVDHCGGCGLACAEGQLCLSSSCCTPTTRTADYTNRGTFQSPMVVSPGVTVTGSASVNVLNFNGLGIVGGVSNNTVDGSETITFTFDTPSVEVSLRVPSAGNGDADGDVGDRILEAFDETGASLGEYRHNGVGGFAISTQFGDVPIARMTIRMVGGDNMRVGLVTFTSCL